MHIYKCSQRDSAVIDSIVKAVTGYQRQIVIPGLYQNTRLLSLLPAVVPELFNVSNFGIASTLLGTILIPDYCYSKQESERLWKECSDEVDIIVNRVRSAKLSAYESALRVHDILAKRVRYEKNDQRYHSIVGPLIDQTGCCEGISKTYKLILDRLGIPCLCVYGKATDTIRGMTGAHQWNMIRIDNKWCHVDVTFDLPHDNMKAVFHTYFGLDDAEIRADHSYEAGSCPVADSPELCYFGRKKTIIHNEDELRRYVAEHIRLNVNCFDIKLHRSYKADDLMNNVINIISGAARENRVFRPVTVRGNPDNRVFIVRLDR